ncbi:MAG: hypothetical protein U0797_00885 [Gemmataceae bacterium]
MKEALTTLQAAKIYDALHPTLGFLTQLEARLSQLGLRPTDGYYQKVREALDAFHRLTVETHYLSCTGGVGRAQSSWRSGRGSCG